MENTLKQLYYTSDQPAAFSGASRLTEVAKNHGIGKKQVHKWLSGQDPYTLHKRIVRKFVRRKTIVLTPNDVWQSDLADVSNLAQWNDDVNFWLVVIDAFTKFVWVKPLRDKAGETIKNQLLSIFNESGQTPTHFHTDKGTEFRNRYVQQLLRTKQINYYTSENPDTKATIAERVIRTIKERVYRYLTHSNSKRYIDHLDELVHGYNRAKHRSIGMAPIEVTPETEDIARRNLNTKVDNRQPRKQAGSHVRIAKEKNTFDKGYEAGWTDEIFKIVSVNRTAPPTYKLEDLAGESIFGQFYERELQIVMPKTVFHIERILRRRQVGGRREVLVKWLGYPLSMCTWEPEQNLIDIQNQ